MAIILNIDTATEKASVCLSQNGKMLLQKENEEQKEHSSWLHVAIEGMIREAGLSMNQLEAVAITSGPGSYTGLRVGMAAAKGICFALNIPLITENTLKVMACGALPTINDPGMLICPMIDARRMEVFTAVYSQALEELFPVSAVILDDNSFHDLLSSQKMLFLGSGTEKWRKMNQNTRSFYMDTPFLAPFLSEISTLKFASGKFTDNNYSEPVYTKEFYTHIKK